MKHETRYTLGFNKYSVTMDPEIKINMFHNSEVKNRTNLLAKSILRS